MPATVLGGNGIRTAQDSAWELRIDALEQFLMSVAGSEADDD